MPIQSVNPYNNQVVRTFEEDSDEKIDEVLEMAGDTFGFWKARPKCWPGAFRRGWYL